MDLRSTYRNAYALLLTMIVIILLSARACSPGGFFGGTAVVGKDSTYVKTVEVFKNVIDTTYTDSIITWYHQHPIQVPEYIYRNRPDGTDTDFSDIIDMINELDSINDSTEIFTYGAKDSVLNYMIYVRSRVKPVSVWLEYDVPSLTIKDSTYQKDSTHTKEEIKVSEKVRVNQVYLGSEAIVYPSFKGGFVSADFISNKGWQVEAGVGYGDFGNGVVPMGKIGFKKLISFRKKK
jgi:hypothetical protein